MVVTANKQINDTDAILRIFIDGKWSVQNFTDYFMALSSLYAFYGPGMSNEHVLDQRTGAESVFWWLDTSMLDLADKEESIKELSTIINIDTISSMQHVLNEYIQSNDYKTNRKLRNLKWIQGMLAEFFSEISLERKMQEREGLNLSKKILDTPSEDYSMEEMIHKEDRNYLDSWWFHRDPLGVTKIRYGSPGFTDVVGIASAIGHLKDFILGLIHAYQTHEKIKAEARLIISHAELVDAKAKVVKAEAEFMQAQAALTQERLSELKAMSISERQILQIEKAVEKQSNVLLAAIYEGRLIGIAHAPSTSDHEADQ